MSMDVGTSKGGLKADINVTPLVDVMLVLLIIMMLVAPMLQKGVNVTLPAAANTIDKPEEGAKQTIVAVDNKNKLYVNSVEVSGADFAERVRKALEDKPEKVVFLRGDQDASYSAIMKAMDDLRKANIEDIGLLTEPGKKTDKKTPTGGK